MSEQPKGEPGYPRLLAPTEIADMLDKLKGHACLVFPSVEEAAGFLNRGKAAPELVEALQAFVRWHKDAEHESEVALVKAGQAALRKAGAL